LQDAIGRVRYTGGYTTTALALILTRRVMDPSRNYGARPSSAGIPKVAILLTDGRSNIYSITDPATNLRLSGVQVYTVGIGNIYLPELRFIASDPDPLHVFLLDSFNSASRFVDFLSFTTCDGKQTTSFRLLHPSLQFPGPASDNRADFYYPNELVQVI